MKKVLVTLLFLGGLAQAYAQKTEIAEAKKKWSLFELTSAGASFDKKLAALNAGLANTDNAIANEKSKDLAESWVYRSLFASAIAVTDTISMSNAMAKQKIAEEAITKAKALDTKQLEKTNIATAETNVRNAILVRGSMAYNKKDFELALTSFEQLLALNPADTSMYVNAGVTAKMLKKYTQAIGHFKKVIDLNSPMTKDLYAEVASMMLNDTKDTVSAMKLMDEALVKFPDNSDFIGMQTDIYIKNGNIEKSQESLQKLIAKDPKKPVYHYLMGDTYYKQALDIQDVSRKLEAERLVLRKKADPKKMREFDMQTDKQVDAFKVKMTGFIDQSIPFYKKSLEIDPVYVPSLESLKQIYGFKNDEVNFTAIKKILEGLPQKN